jgi:hypothetical protein
MRFGIRNIISIHRLHTGQKKKTTPVHCYSKPMHNGLIGNEKHLIILYGLIWLMHLILVLHFSVGFGYFQ